MKLRKVSGCDNGTCPAVYLSSQGTAVVQGSLIRQAEGLALGPGETAVELPIPVLVAALPHLRPLKDTV